MTTYVIADLHVTDPDKAADYRRQVEPIIAKHGGTYLVRGGHTQTLEGDWTPGRVVVLAFPDRESAEGFYNDPDYAPLIALRQASASGSLIMVDGLD